MSITPKILLEAVERGRIPHAVLVTGEPSAAKNETVRRFAGMLLCSQSPKPCGVCRGCRLVAAGAHPDLLYVLAQKGTIRIEAVRKAIGELAKKPYGDAHRALIIENAQEMSVQAQNCLLKTLEEPPERTVFILTCCREQELLPTVVSRCLAVRITGEGETAIQARLEKEFRLDAGAAALYARLGRGHHDHALEWMKQDGPMALREALWSMLKGLAESGADPLRGYALFKDYKDETGLILAILTGILTDVLLHKQGAKALNSDHAEDVGLLAGKFSGPGLQRGLEHILKAGALLEHNVQHQMLVEDLLLKLKDALEDSVDGQSYRRAL